MRPVPEASFDMSISREEFLSRLPAAVGGDPYVEEGSALVYRGDARGWRIDLESLPDLQIALVRLERLRVRLDFENYDEAEVQRFLRRFHLYFRRGGG